MKDKSNKYIDLHTHTIYSDGGLAPSQLVEKAKEIGLIVIAVSDHESTDGVDEAIRKGKKLGVEVVPAVEITSYPTPLTEHHILGYFVDCGNKNLQDELAKIRRVREERSKKVIEKLNSLGFQINFGDVKALSSGTIVAPHIAWSIVGDAENHKKLKKEFGQVPDTGEFIRKYLIPGAPAYVAREAMTPKEAIDLIHEAGGIAVVAHPCWTLVEKKEGKLEFDDAGFGDLVEDGIDGVEALAHRENEEDTKKCVEHFSKLAEKNNLVVTGGSDFHGFGSAGKNLGFVDFYLKVPYEILENLKLRIHNSK
ncbi:MAG: PHP domain-containing protein [Candidatus Woykebacteria bacterium]